MSLNAHGNPFIGFHKTLSAFRKKGFSGQGSGFSGQDFSPERLWKKRISNALRNRKRFLV
jgi:hypothetical protein